MADRILSARTINFDGLQCKTTDGKVVHYFVYHRGGVLRLLDPILSGTDVIPSVKNAKDAQIEIAKVYGVEVIP